MKPESYLTLNVLMDELNRLLDEKIQDQEIRQLYEEYQHREGVSEESLDLFKKEYGVRLPGDFRTFYQRKDGSGYGLHVLYPGDAETGRCTPFI